MVGEPQLTKFHEWSMYDLLDRKATLEKAYDLMEIYQRKWLRTHKRGGMVASVHDVLQAILSILPRTMEDMKKEQPNVFGWAVYSQEFFCFTNNEYLASMVNKQAARPILQISGRTVRNCIKKLLEAQILTQKVNFVHTGKNYPEPMHEDPNGRGYFKLVVNKDILVWGETMAEVAGEAAQSDSPGTPINTNTVPSFPQMYSILDNKDTLKQYKTPAAIVNKASAVAELNSLANEGTEQGSKLNLPTVSTNLPVNFAPKVFIPTKTTDKEEFFAQQLFEQARVALWGGKNFNALQQIQAIDFLRSHLRLTRDFVQHFRKQKIEAFKDSDYYQKQGKNPKRQWKILNEWFVSKLPPTELSAVRIVAEAIQKQRENGLKRGYLNKLYAPQYYFTSENWTKALDYSKDDFMKLYTQFGAQNRSLSYYQMVMEHIHKSHTATLQALKDGTTPQYAMNVTEKAWRKIRSLIAQAPPEVSQAQKDKLIRKFKDRLQPIFSNQIS